MHITLYNINRLLLGNQVTSRTSTRSWGVWTLSSMTNRATASRMLRNGCEGHLFMLNLASRGQYSAIIVCPLSHNRHPSSIGDSRYNQNLQYKTLVPSQSQHPDSMWKHRVFLNILFNTLMPIYFGSVMISNHFSQEWGIVDIKQKTPRYWGKFSLLLFIFSTSSSTIFIGLSW